MQQKRSFSEKLRHTIGEYLLLSEIKKKQVKHTFTPLDIAKDIGIIYHATHREEEAAIHHYANELRSQGKKVFLMGYVHAKELPGNKKFSLQSEYFWKEKLTPFNLPEKGKIGRFLDIEFDLLLNLYTEHLLPMQALSAYTKSKYRVGPKMKNGIYYVDAMIDTGSNHQLDFLIEQIDFYLRNI